MVRIWATEQSDIWISEKIDPCFDFGENMGKEIAAIADIESGECLIRLQPGTYIQEIQATVQHAFQMFEQKKQESMKTFSIDSAVKLPMVLLHEYSLDKASRFYGYIQSLPKHVPVPLTWSDEERELLSITAAYVVLYTH